MARIQILELPSEVVGEYVRTPFAIVIDQVETEQIPTSIHGVSSTEYSISRADSEGIKAATGAGGVILSTTTLDVVL
ncbi:hypothetical protein E3T43_07310 [Cryobacterium sp. Hh7]|uniref:hypothetical protein n=1 Tax=Cryobacterium sp. Hh7 TaxID=1259159 RepID=UPI00106CDF38|nr:hypothetical protein [Cryobacterium sp. Hh7]TFD58047.1 hypothetical protein E3T43_07310 [Cryobacterium sp. Hh7]